MKALSQPALAYLAAIIDGEGVITISKGHSRSSTRPCLYRPLIIVTNSHAGLIGFLRQLTGVGYVYQNKKPPRENWSPIHRWQVSTSEARKLASVLIPWLVIKREQASIISTLVTTPKNSTRDEKECYYGDQIAAYERVKLLNERGSTSTRASTLLSDFPSDHPLISRNS